MASYDDRPTRAGDSQDAGMVWGILSLVFAFCCPLLGIIFGFVGMSKASKSTAANAGTVKTLSMVGIIVSILMIVLNIVLQLMGMGIGALQQ